MKKCIKCRYVSKIGNIVFACKYVPEEYRSEIKTNECTGNFKTDLTSKIQEKVTKRNRILRITQFTNEWNKDGNCEYYQRRITDIILYISLIILYISLMIVSIAAVVMIIKDNFIYR